MKIALCGDIHWSQYSSILRKRGTNYSVRLENLVQSVNWFNQVSNEHNCIANFYLGDFFDKSDLNAEEVSALSGINWSNCDQYFICGNHEMGISNHTYSSAKVFNLLNVGTVLDKTCQLEIDNLDICILPYILESNRKPMDSYFKNNPNCSKRLILSHNDISRVQMGKFISQSGFSINEITSNCDLFINGHLHNGEAITDKILNIGNLTGQNFSEDASRYQHKIFILDTETLELQSYINPFALNFYKIDMTNWSQLVDLQITPNSVVSVKCKSSWLTDVKKLLENNLNIIESRATIQPEFQVINEQFKEELTVDHLETFKQYMLNNFENTKDLLDELQEVLY